MNVILPTRLTVDEFLRWSLEYPGRYELEGGRIIQMSPQNMDHVRTKQRVYAALDAAIQRASVAFYAMPDGPSVRISRDRAYEPDASVAPLPMPPGDALEVPNPIIVIEVLSPTPTSMRRDLSIKVEGYGRVPSIEHYIIIDPAERQVLHYRRKGETLAPPSEPTEGLLRLDPPGLEVPVADLLIAETP